MKARRARFLALCILSFLALPAHGFVVDIKKGSDTLYLRVGNAPYNGSFADDDEPPTGTRGPINIVSVTVPAAALGNGTSQPMKSNASNGTSFYDGFAFCNAPDEVYVGGFNRKSNNGNGNGGDGTLSVAVTIPLTNAAGDTIPFSEISWTSSGNGDGPGQPFPSGSFTGGTQPLGSFPFNTWRESCHRFSYLNSTFVAAGTYSGRVTYTLSVP
jgi:hypothetical protein